MADAEKILIVEDDVDLAEMLSAYFNVQGYNVTTANWGEEGVKLANEINPNVVILDIRLPDINGYEVCRRLRQGRKSRDVPIIFLTEKRERDDRLEGLALGAFDYITKPFDIQELRLRVRNALRRSRVQSAINSVTSLPEAPILHEQLQQMFTRPDWGLVFAGIKGLKKFRDLYGFVAADDVSRAVSIMFMNTMKEIGTADDFIAHFDEVHFVIITTAEICKPLAETCYELLKPSVQFFYPAMERQDIVDNPSKEHLSVQVTSISSRTSPFKDVDKLWAALTNAVKS